MVPLTEEPTVLADRMLVAFLACICLTVVGVVGDLTDADFAKIGSLLDERLSIELDKRDERLYIELDKRDERLYTELGKIKSTIDALETKFDTLETKFDNLNSTVSAQIGDLKTYFTTAFPILTFSTAIALK